MGVVRQDFESDRINVLTLVIFGEFQLDQFGCARGLPGDRVRAVFLKPR